MPTNLIKKYPELLDIMCLTEEQRIESLTRIFNRDIVNNQFFLFRNKQIHPILADGEDSMGTLFNHLTREEIEITESDGISHTKRIFEPDRSMRLHWIKFHVDENKKEKVEIFSVIERDTKRRKDVTKTYIYDIEQKYVIVLEPQNSATNYYLLSAYYLNKPYGVKTIQKKLKKKLAKVV